MTSAPAEAAPLASRSPGASRWPSWLPRVRQLARLLAAPVGGLLMYASCAPRTLWWLAPIAFALLWVALVGRGWRAGFGVGVLFGLGYYVPLLPWVGIYVGAMPWLVLAAFEALLVGVGATLIAQVSRLPWAPLWSAALWVAAEAVAARFPFGGFSWGKVAFSQADGPFVRLAAIGGTPLVSFGVVLTGFGLAWLVADLPRARVQGLAWRPRLTSVVCVLLPVLCAVLAPGWLTGAHPGAPQRTVTVAAVQGNVPRLGLDFNSQRRAVLDYHVRRTQQLAADIAAHRVPRPDFVIWPENSSDVDPLRNPDAYAEISATVDRLGVPVLVGAVLVEPDNQHTTNTSLVWQPGVGPTERNDKRRILPFGEYLPWRPFFRLFSSYADRAGYFVAGHGPGTVRMDNVTVGIAICWEIAFDDTVNESIRHGAQVLVVPTNNATFGKSEMTFQQLAMSRLRAVEHDRAVVVAATTGESAIIAPDGGLLGRTPLFTPAALVRPIPLLNTTTLATRLGAGPEWALTLIGLAALGLALRGRRRGAAAQNEDGADQDG